MGIGMSGGNDWNRSELLVMKTLERVEGKVDSNSNDIVSLKVEVAKIAAKVGTLAGVLSAMSIEGMRFLISHIK